MLKSLTSALVVAAALALAGAASAAEMAIVVKSYDPSARTIVAEDGATFVIQEGVTVTQLRAGSKLKVMVEEKAGKKVVTKIIE